MIVADEIQYIIETRRQYINARRNVKRRIQESAKIQDGEPNLKTTLKTREMLTLMLKVWGRIQKSMQEEMLQEEEYYGNFLSF